MPFEFHSSKRQSLGADCDLREMIESVVKQFERQKPINQRQRKATTVAAVWQAGPAEYYAVMIVGPTANLETLEMGLIESGKDCVPSARKIGVK